MRLRRLLYMSEYPPGPAGGAPIITRQHLRAYDPASLHVLCDRRFYRAASQSGPDALLSCPHTSVPNLEVGTLRPRRFFKPLFDAVNLARIPLIRRRARAIIERDAIEAIMTVPWRTDFALAAYLVARDTGLPLYVFETDDWHAANRGPLVSSITRRWQVPLLADAAHLWVTSPQMSRIYKERFGVDSEFLFHFVQPEVYRQAEPREPSTPGELRVVYTGAINRMFLGTLERIAEWLNHGMVIDDRKVTLDLWSAACPDHLLGPGVRWRGFVPATDVPGILASADVSLIGITFSESPELRELVKSSLYTKTVDYLASGTPLVVVSPPDTAELDYFGSVVWPVTTLDREAFEDAVRAATSAEARERAHAGFKLICASHTPDTMGERFLARFRTDG